MLKIIKNLAYMRYKKLKYEEVSNAFNSSMMVFCASRFNLSDYFKTVDDLCVRKIYLEQDPILRFSAQVSTARLVIEDDEERTEDIFLQCDC